MESFISYKPQAPGNRRACLLLRLSCSLSLISREPRHFHWVQVPTLLSLARALSPGGKAQIAHKVVPPEMAPSALSDLLSCPTQTGLVQSPERLSQMIERVQGTQTDSPELMVSQEWATRGKTKQVSLAAGCCTVNREYLAAPVHRDNPWSVPHSDLSLYFPPLHLGLSPRSTGYSGLAAQTQGLAGEYTQHHSRCQWP